MNKTFILVCLLAVSFHVEKVVVQEELTVPHANDPAWNKAEKTLNAVWTTTDYHVDKFKCPASASVQKQQLLTGWRGERVHAKLLLWSPTTEGVVFFLLPILKADDG